MNSMHATHVLAYKFKAMAVDVRISIC